MTPQELKNSILQLAIQGKLVEQRPEEGTAEELYKQIQVEKQRLIKLGKIKKAKSIVQIPEDDIPFDIPASWKWVRISELGEVFGGGTPKTEKLEYWDESGIPWLTPADMKFITGKYARFGERNISVIGLEKSSAQLMPKGTILYSSRAPIGYIAIAANDISTNQGFKSLVPAVMEINEFMYYCLMARTSDIVSRASGTTFKEISGTDFGLTIIPLPPLAEQKRIVAKIEELLPYIDRYEQAWSKLEDFNNRFPNDLQKSILQMAIQGKLVDQRPEEGTGEELYQQIQAEKQKLIKAGTIKKEKPLPEIAEDEKPFDIPESWKWVRMSEVIDVRDGTHDTPAYIPKGYPLITGKDFYFGKFDFSKTQYISESNYLEISKRSLVEIGDILFSMIGGNIGSMIHITEDNYFEMAIKNVALFKQYLRNDTLSTFLLVFLKSQVGNLKAIAKGGAQAFVPLKLLRNYSFPLPPLAEQKRIVAKLEEILPLCEKLK